MHRHWFHPQNCMTSSVQSMHSPIHITIKFHHPYYFIIFRFWTSFTAISLHYVQSFEGFDLKKTPSPAPGPITWKTTWHLKNIQFTLERGPLVNYFFLLVSFGNSNPWCPAVTLIKGGFRQQKFCRLLYF